MLYFFYSRGSEFRTDYSQLGMLSAFFPNASLIALTATANKFDRTKIKESLNMKNPFEVIGDADRPNIFYSKAFRQGEEITSYESILRPIAEKLLKLNLNYPITILYLPLKWCGFAYKLFDSILGKEQYFPHDADHIPENRLFAQYHAPQTLAMKEMILCQLTSSSPTVQVVFATVAIGMGVDIPSIREIIHVGPPSSVQQYFQETGRAGRDGLASKAVLYYNNRDISKNRHVGEDMRSYCRIEDQCLRSFLLKYLQCGEPSHEYLGHRCCSFCSMQCLCPDCDQH